MFKNLPQILFPGQLTRLIAAIQRISRFEAPQRILKKSQSEIGSLESSIEDLGFEIAEVVSRLKGEKSQMQAMLKSMAEGVLAVDANQRIILANPAFEKMFQVLEPDIIGKTARAAIFNNEIADSLDEAVRSKSLIEKEITIVTPIKRTFSINSMPISEDKGAVTVIHDVTKERELEKYRSEFLANVSHELKTPLTSIRSYVETLLNGAINDSANNIGFLKKIEKNAKNLSALIDDLLEISRLESKEEVNPFVPVDLNKVVLRAIDTLSEKARNKQIKIIEKLTQDSNVSGIEDHLYRAILNLLDNAINYSEPESEIAISINKIGGKLEVSVKDHGLGIAEKNIPRLFERFYRVDNARSRDIGGTGLGLAIVKHVMNLHGGEVKVISEEGKGSTFTLIFGR